VVDEDSAVLKKLEQAIARGTAKVIDRLTLAATSGRRTEVFIGEKVPYPVRTKRGLSTEFQRFGTSIEATAILDGTTVSLDSFVYQAERNECENIKIEDFSIPGARVGIAVKSQAKMKLGQVLILYGATQAVPNDESASETTKANAKKPKGEHVRTFREVQALVLLRVLRANRQENP
jgi:hypothetical protein